MLREVRFVEPIQRNQPGPNDLDERLLLPSPHLSRVHRPSTSLERERITHSTPPYIVLRNEIAMVCPEVPEVDKEWRRILLHIQSTLTADLVERDAHLVQLKLQHQKCSKFFTIGDKPFTCSFTAWKLNP
jgi:hypothetical protein